jgi:hypothetical protein
MSRTSIGVPALRMAALALMLASGGISAAERSDPGVVSEWNELLEGLLPAGGLSQPRHYAMLHVAMFDAINSVERTHRPYRLAVRAPAGASAEVAAAQAAHDVLVAQFQAASATLDAALEARIASAAPGEAATAITVGKAVAAAVLAWRQNDGWTTPPPPYVLPELPGAYQPTSATPAAFRQFQYLEPFALLTSTQYLPDAPPTLTSERYARDLEEVRAVGAKVSASRTTEQTQLAELFANVTSRTAHWALWNHVARDTAQARGLSLVETARLYALLNVAIHDGLQTSHTSKFVYGFWRPITAIQRADEDLNPLTAGDPTWQPLLTTPPYPSHAGNMACVSASAARALVLFHGSDEVPFTAAWQGSTGHPDVARPYASFSQLAADQANSRIYGGIHFRFESEASQRACPKVAEYVFARFMQPR